MEQHYKMVKCPVTTGTFIRLYKELKDRDNRHYWSEIRAFHVDWLTKVEFTGAELSYLLNAAMQGRLETEVEK